MELPVGSSGRDAVTIARACAERAVEQIRTSFRRVTVTAKGDKNVVTEADVAVERLVTAILREEFPSHVVLSEEEASGSWSDEWMWVCDPIDGTKNFSQGIPHFGFSIALCYGGMPVLGLTVHPLLGWEVLAVQGQGCTFNGEPTSVSSRQSIRESVLSFDLGYDSAAGAAQLALAASIWPNVQSVRITGSATLGFAYVAAGLWDAYSHADLCPWDIAAGLILVTEAGGLISAMDGLPADLHTRHSVAGAPAVQRELISIVQARAARA